MGCPQHFSGSEQVTSPQALDPAGKGMWLCCVAKRRGWNEVPSAVFTQLLDEHVLPGQVLQGRVRVG